MPDLGPARSTESLALSIAPERRRSSGAKYLADQRLARSLRVDDCILRWLVCEWPNPRAAWPEP